MQLRKIVVATDFSEAARAAVRRARSLASQTGAEIIVLHAFDPGRPGASIDERVAAELVAEERNAIGLLLEGEREELARAGVRALQLRIDGSAAEVIPAAAAAEAADLLILGPNGRSGVRRVLLGNVVEKTIRASHVPVLVARGAGEVAFHRVLVATDFGEPAERALATALELARPGARVEVVHFAYVAPMVAAPFHTGDEVAHLRAQARARGEELLKKHRGKDLDLTFLSEVGDPREGVLFRVEERGHDLIAVGSHARTGLRRAFLGTVSEAIVRHAHCSVLVAR